MKIQSFSKIRYTPHWQEKSSAYYNLLTNREPYMENDEIPIKNLKLPKDKISNTMTADEMIKILSDAGYVISKPVRG